MSNELMQLVDQIPVDQKAPAKYPMKKFILAKLNRIFDNRIVIERAARDKRKQEILDAYKKNVGFDKKLKALQDAEAKLVKAQKELMEIGIGEKGQLLVVSEDKKFGQIETTVLWDNNWVPVSKETYQKVKKVNELLNAVEGVTETYSEFDRLETKLMMASTVGEIMVILNAAIGTKVFTVKTKALELEETTTK